MSPEILRNKKIMISATVLAGLGSLSVVHLASGGQNQAKRCERQSDLNPNSFNSCEYRVIFNALKRTNPKWLRAHHLHTPGKDTARDRQVVYFKTHPEAYYNYKLEHMPPRNAAKIIWQKEYNWAPYQVREGYGIIDQENTAWNPCAGNGENTFTVTCETTSAYNGSMQACGIPQFQPCRLLGEPIAQIRAFADYVKDHHGGIDQAYSYKQRTGVY